MDVMNTVCEFKLWITCMCIPCDCVVCCVSCCTAAATRLDMKSTQPHKALISKIHLNIIPITFLYIQSLNSHCILVCLIKHILCSAR